MVCGDGDGAGTMALERFFWMVEGALAGCSRPGGNGRGPASTTATHEALEADLAWLRERGIGAVLSLTEEPLEAGAVERAGMGYLHVPVRDMEAPEPEEIERALAFIDRQRLAGRAVAVHCRMGQGRTGTILAAYLIRSGRTAQEALAELRAACRGAVSAGVQERALEAYARRRDWVV